MEQGSRKESVGRAILNREVTGKVTFELRS